MIAVSRSTPASAAGGSADRDSWTLARRSRCARVRQQLMRILYTYAVGLSARSTLGQAAKALTKHVCTRSSASNGLHPRSIEVRRHLNEAFFHRLFADDQGVGGGWLTDPVLEFRERPLASQGYERSPNDGVVEASYSGRSHNLPLDPRVLSSSKTNVVGLTGFEPAASSSRTRRATKLRHSPIAASDRSRATSTASIPAGERRSESRSQPCPARCVSHLRGVTERRWATARRRQGVSRAGSG
jgi:hypothetical protein